METRLWKDGSGPGYEEPVSRDEEFNLSRRHNFPFNLKL